MVIPFALNLTLFSLALAYRVALVSSGIMTTKDFVLSLVAGLSLCLMFVILQAATKAIKKVDGFGLGDMYLAPSLGLLLGWPKILPGMFMAFMIGSLVGIILMAAKKKSLGQYLPFAPFLILGTVLSLLWGNNIWAWYTAFLV
jgi:leader peptidase (prepilin peptidase)/N-methyltransferase